LSHHFSHIYHPSSWDYRHETLSPELNCRSWNSYMLGDLPRFLQQMTAKQDCILDCEIHLSEVIKIFQYWKYWHVCRIT
jgi:hypothetical protein